MADRTLLVLVLTAMLAVLSWDSAHAASTATQIDLPLDAWQFNATDNWSDASAPAAPAAGAAWVPLTEALSRQWQMEHPRNRGGEVWYRFDLSNLKDIRREGPWVLEFSYPKTIQQVLLDGTPLKDLTSAKFGRGLPGKTFYLPSKEFADAKQILVKVSDFDYRYASHFGRASLRPMEPFERFFIEELRPSGGAEAAPAISLNLTNLSGEPAAAQVVVEVYEYFGQLLRTETYDFKTGSGGVALKAKTPRDYRVLLRVKAGDSLSTPYWGYFRGAAERAEENEFRTVNVLRGGRAAWSYRWVKESEGFSKDTPLPADGWSDKIPITGMWYYDEPGLPFWFRTQNIPTHRIWFKRTVDIPADAAGKAVFVFLRDVCYKVDLYVDGKPAGTRMQYELPDRIDITKFVTPGQKCELQFAVTDAIVCRAPESGTLKDGQHANSNFIGPAPSRDANIGFTVWPEVHITPKVLTEHSLVRTTFTPRKQLEYHTIIRNTTDKPVELEVVREILLRGKLVKTLLAAPEKVTVPPGQFTTDVKAEAWPDAVEWTLENPELYTLRTTLRQIAQPGQPAPPVDVHQLRFGFRELAIDGTNITLNGKVIRPYGATLSCVGYGHHPEFMNFARLDRVAFNSFRWFFPNMADERGYFITWETTGWDPCGGGQYLAGDDRLYANNLSLWKRISLYSRQHPSIFCYTCSNEQPWIDKAVATKMAKLLDDIAAFEAAPGRFAIHSRGANLYGQAKIDTPHYFYFYHMLPTDMLWFDVPGDKRPKEVHDRLAKDPGDVGYEGPQTEWWGSTPLFDSEGMSVTDGHEYIPWLVGDSVWVSGMNRPGRGPDLAADKMRAYMWSIVRLIRLSAVQAHHGSMAGLDALHPTAAYLKTVEPRAYSGEPTTRDITVVNETSSPRDIHVTARLLDAVDHELWKFEHDSHLDIAGRDKLTLDLKMPKVDAPTYYQLELRTRTEGLPDYCESHRLTVFPRREIAWPNNVVLYDPAGQTAEALRKHGFKGPVVGKLDISALADTKLLLIGKDGTAALMSQGQPKAVQQAVARGLKVLVLPQTSIVDVFPRHVEDGENTSCSNGVVVASPSHPVLGGTGSLREEDFLFWATPWRVPTTFENAPFMPVDPAVKPILVGGETRSWQLMGYSPLMEMRHGRGCYLICQMSVVRSLGLDPAADLLMNNMLAYLDSPASTDPAPMRAAKVLPTSGAMAEMLRRENEVILAQDSSPDAGTIIVDGLIAEGLAGLGGVKSSIAGGAKLLVHGLDVQTVKALKDVFGLEVTLEDFSCSQAFRTTPSFVLEGMTNYDLQWEHSAGGLKGRKPSDLDVGRQRISVKAGAAGAAGAAVVYPMLPEYVAVVPFQKGVIVLDNVRWDKITSKRARRYAGSFLANLGCAFNFKQEETDALKFANLSSFDLSPIDLAKFCNRGLADDEGRGNGKGGWTDEGKGHDIGSLPVGRQTFAGVPFEVADPARNNGNGLIAFRGHSWSQLPATAPEIPIGRKIDKLYVLHAAAWVSLEAGGELARIKVYYQDRKTWIPGLPDPFSVIPVKNKINITDWWGVGAVADGDSPVPQAKVAWVDSGANRNRGIMAMEWINPYPDKVVDAIEVESTSDKAQYFLIALTTATRKAGAVAASQPVARDVTESDPLPEGVKFQKGMKCVQAGQFRMYVAPSMAVPWLGCTDGRPLLKDLGWTLTTQTPGKADSYITGIAGFPAGSKIPPLTVEERNGAIFVAAHAMPNRAFSWNGQYELTDSTIRVKYELTPRDDIKKILDGKTPNLSAGCGVALANRISGLTLRNGDWGRGFFSVRTKAGTLIFNFTDRFTRYQKNVWWWDEGQGFGIPPRNLNWYENGPDKAVIEYEVRLTGVTPVKN